MKLIVDKPENISQYLLNQLIDLVVGGGQVKRHFVERGINAADVIGMYISDNIILSSATLKNPLKAHIDDVFHQARVNNFNFDSYKELGYIVTNPQYEGQKLCQKLLKDFFEILEVRQMFATTRKPEMIHILSKFGFKPIGKTFNNDLTLLVPAIPNA